MDSLPKEDSQSRVDGFWITYKVPLILGAISIFVVIISLVLLVKSTQTTTPIQFTGHDNVAGTASASLKTMTVDIEGAVATAGVYGLPSGARVEDAIEAGGGLTGDADTEYIAKNINRAMKVTDGMKIYIPFMGETSHIITPLLRSPDGSSQNGGGVSVNSSSKEQLDSLAGVGPVTAQKIIDNRPYSSLEDLVAKKAIGPSLFEKLKNQLSL